MDKLETYRELIKKILTEHARFRPSHGEIEPLLIFDDDHQSYQLMYLGWDKHRRVHTTIIHLRLHEGKIWVEYDGTQAGVAATLLENGVPKEDIVLAFHSLEKRKYTEFAVT